MASSAAIAAPEPPGETPAQAAQRRLAVYSGARRWAAEQEALAKAEVAAMLERAHADTGAANLTVRLFGEEVGSVCLPVSKPRVYVADEAAYQDWLRERFVLGDERVAPVYEAPLVLKCAEPREQDDGGWLVFDGRTGEPVDGLSYEPGGELLAPRFSGCGHEKVLGVLKKRRISFADALKGLEGGD